MTRNGKLRITSGTGSNLTLSGRVTYFRSPTSEPVPVPGVRVTLWPRNEFSRKAVTDNAGMFSFTGLMEPPPPAPGEDWEPTEAAVELKAAKRLSRIDSAIVRLRDASAEEMPFTSLTRREASRVKSAQKRLTRALAVATKLLVREHDRVTALQRTAHAHRVAHVAAQNRWPSTEGRKSA